ncbi:glycoside hydrolase family 47 protein [Phanerochaete carnosa HHB-10118-sp]|uniref:alpha-1,2-Mannosidase n=1 Tax=Phanerochaete carnosa (strain HHB-10118-sp) TaxID=650164 RepID=K5WJP4_PHACS|nr:glycoside hydrolase family 47 protein [Phanerochaete carnosa HHB-10118-sp]EKM59635.1 glycoside hydrolase family 47 protein [Phanerochaete carnosa HHB-10118-sp]
MKWPTHWPRALLLLVVATLEAQSWSHHSINGVAAAAPWTRDRKLQARCVACMNNTRELWYHGFDNYMKHGAGPDWYNLANVATNDVAGNFSVTLVDALDTLVVLNDTIGFENAVQDVIRAVSFNVNTKPQVFETTIRVLGGLLSGHQFASKPGQPFYIPWYRGELLSLAHDLGERLLPAFKTPTGLPYARINLRHGIRPGESIDSCTAGAGSLILEFGTLSRLTGDDRFEKAAYKAFFALWNKRSDIGLVGNTVNIWTGTWTHPEVNGIGAGVDSFYEYALKWYILSGEVEFLDVFQEAYAAVMRYSRAPDGFWGDPVYLTVDSLSAFWPGLQVLAGDIENAIKSHMIYWNLWKKFAGLPEGKLMSLWDMSYRAATSLQYPLRPEFVESTWYLYRATRDPFYLDVGERILSDIIVRAKVDCGLTGISDLKTNNRDDRMESFVLSETLKYLYLLFDEENELHRDDSNMVLTTEGHLLSMNRKLEKPISAVRRELRRVEHLSCPAYKPPVLATDPVTGSGLTGGVYTRPDVDYARALVAAPATGSEEYVWSPDGFCQMPKVDLYTFDFLLSPDGQAVPEDFNPTSKKLVPVSDGYVLQDVAGIRAYIVSRMDGKGYDVTKLGPYSVKTGQIVYVNDSHLLLAPLDGKGAINEDGVGSKRRSPEVELRIYLDFLGSSDAVLQLHHEAPSEAFITASTAMFGADPAASYPDNTVRFGRGEGARLVRDPSNSFGCMPYKQKYAGEALVVRRGECTFLDKLFEAAVAGASGVIAISDEDHSITPSAGADELQGIDDLLEDAAIVVVNRSDGELITAMLNAADGFGTGQVRAAIAPETVPTVSGGGGDEEFSSEARRQKARDGNRILYLNGHPLVNTRLMV